MSTSSTVLPAWMSAGIFGARSAPSAHNIQPWRFSVDGDAVALGWDPARELPHGDPRRQYLITSLGAAAEGFVVAAACQGTTVDVAFDLQPAANRAASLRPAAARPREPDVALGRGLPYRQTTRLPLRRRPPSSASLGAMGRQVEALGGGFLAETGGRIRQDFAGLVTEATALNMGDRAVFAEFADLVRIDSTDPAYLRDGLTLDTLAGTAAMRLATARLLRPGTMDWLVRLRLHRLAAASQGILALRAGGVGLVVARSGRPDDLFRGGRAMMRMWLAATRLGVRIHPLTAPLDHVATRGELTRLFDLDDDAAVVLSFRFGNGPPGRRSPRLPVDQLVAA